MSIPEQQLLVLAGQSLTAIVDQISDEQWDLPADTGMSQGTVRDLVVAHARDAQWVGNVLSGRPLADFGEPPFDGGGDLRKGWRTIMERAAADALALDDPDKIVHLSFGDYPARDYLQQIVAYHGLQAWDLARVLKVDDTLPADLVDGMTRMLGPVVEQWRELGVFGPAVEVPAEASAQDTLLALTGRRP